MVQVEIVAAPYLHLHHQFQDQTSKLKRGVEQTGNHR